MTEYEHPDTAELQLPAVLFALSDPVRLDIVRQVATASGSPALTCQSVAVDLPKSTRSHHLKVLREAGVIRYSPQGRERVLHLRGKDLEQRWPGLLAAVLAEQPAPA